LIDVVIRFDSSGIQWALCATVRQGFVSFPAVLRPVWRRINGLNPQRSYAMSWFWPFTAMQ